MILFSFFEKFKVNDFLIRLINLHICLILPIIFYKCLKIKFKYINKKYLILLSGLIFLSPTLDLYQFGQIVEYGDYFFCLSIHYFLLYKNDKNFRYCIYICIFLFPLILVLTFQFFQFILCSIFLKI